MENNEIYSMRTYIGTKTVQAIRMDADKARRAGANVPGKYFEVGNASYNPGADGYLIDYPDGYRSWSPKQTFEAAYKVAETHLDRMKIELDDLGERISEATHALWGGKGDLLERQNEPYWQSLQAQVGIMVKYMDILHTRIQQELDKSRCNINDRKEA